MNLPVAARRREVPTTPGREVNIATAASVEDAIESVRSWLEDLVASQANDDSRNRPRCLKSAGPQEGMER